MGQHQQEVLQLITQARQQITNMKGVILLTFLFSTALGFSQWAVFSAKYATIKFPKTNEGTVLHYIYEIKNTGEIPLEIYSFEAECTCTEIKLPKKPIEPGQKGKIELTFDTNGKYFFQDRVIYFDTNTRRKREKLRFKVYVVPKTILEESEEKAESKP